MTPKVLIVLGSTRQNRQGEAVARWIAGRAIHHADATYEVVDLKDWPLPFLESPTPPALGHYDAAARPWADLVAAADGYIFVTPEYNHGYPAVLKNALDHVYREWGYKPAAIVSYGGPGAGFRGAEQLRQVLIELRMVPIRDQVGVPSPWQAFDAEGRVRDEGLARQADAMLTELAWLAAALMPARANRSAVASAA